MRNLLDNRRAISRFDSEGMLDAVGQFPDYMSDQLSAVLTTVKRTSRSKFRNMIFIGMGGSASAADVVLDWSTSKLTVPAIVHRDPVLPKFVNSDTLSIVLSYSGDTRESLVAFREASRRGSRVISIGTGGRLQTLSRELGVPFLTVKRALAPRAALGQMVVASALALHRLEMVSDPKTEIEVTIRQLRQLNNTIRPRVPFSRNLAKQLARSLNSRFPIIFAFRTMGSVARRFKNQLAENSKIIAKCSLLPEAGHNEIEALSDQGFPLVPVFIRDPLGSKPERNLLESFLSTVKLASGIIPEQVRLDADTRLGALLKPILLLDYVSVYLAFLRGIDPTDTPWIRLYKQRQ